MRRERSYYKALHELERLQQARAGHLVRPPQVIEIHGDVPTADPSASAPSPVAPSPAPHRPSPPSACQPAQNKTDKLLQKAVTGNHWRRA